MFHTVIRYGSWMNKLPERTGEKEKNRSKYGRRQQHLLFFLSLWISPFVAREPNEGHWGSQTAESLSDFFLYRVVVVGNDDEWIFFDCLENGFEAIKEACDSLEGEKAKTVLHLFALRIFGQRTTGREKMAMDISALWLSATVILCWFFLCSLCLHRILSLDRTTEHTHNAAVDFIQFDDFSKGT